MQHRMSETQCKTFQAYIDYLKHNSNEVQTFIDALHISYSEFFRNPLTFSVLEEIILPSIISKKKDFKNKEIRIWSAACAGGQEAYSMAMLLEEDKNQNKANLAYRIFATDLCESQVLEAQKGEYGAESLNSLSMKRSKQWFDKHADKYTVKSELKESVNFSVFDLLSNQFSCPPASIFGDFDIVFCANLLFYYTPKFRKIILEKATNCLAKGGYIVVGETERNILLQHDYVEVIPQSAIFKSNISSH
jgi:chemotaxis methyl-accepting protein methylase